MKPLNQLTATEIVQAIAAGRTTCEAVTRACLDRIAEREPQVQAWQYLDPDLALGQARALDRRGKRGPLQGVPVGMKTSSTRPTCRPNTARPYTRDTGRASTPRALR